MLRIACCPGFWGERGDLGSLDVRMEGEKSMDNILISAGRGSTFIGRLVVVSSRNVGRGLPAPLNLRQSPAYFLAHDTSLRVMTTEWDDEACTVGISGVWFVLAKIESFRIESSRDPAMP